MQSLRLLVAEDNPANQLVARMMLEKMGHKVEIAGNGEEALARLAQNPPDAVLMDCHMPVLDGYAATRRIRSGQVAGVEVRIPIIALTAYAMPDDRLKCLQAGMDDYLTKPVRATELQGVLLRLGLLSAGMLVETVQPEEPIFDQGILDPTLMETLRSLPGRNGPSLLPELIVLFLQEEPQRLRRMSDLLAARQSIEMAELAHLMAGSASNFGATSLRVAALALENAAKTVAWNEAATSAEAVEKQSACLRTVLVSLQTISSL